jgi:hypothetical protein
LFSNGIRVTLARHHGIATTTSRTLPKFIHSF